MSGEDISWGPSGEVVYNRTYSRVKLDGEMETWPETVVRVVDGNLGLVEKKYHNPKEREDLIRLMTEFKIIPAGRHLWMSGVPGRQFLSNCHVAGWTENIEDHFTFTLLRLAEGGGVGTNYSRQENTKVTGQTRVHIVCDPSHPDYESMKEAGVLTSDFSSDWTGSIDVEDSREGWAEALADLFRAATGRTKHMKRVYDVSRIRWRGARIKSFGGTASGPEPLARMLLAVGRILNNAESISGGRLTPIHAMEIDHEIAQCIVAGGVRRSARMSILHWRDPYIFDFINSKKDPDKNWTTNISVEVDQEFFEALDNEAHHPTLVLDAVAQGMLLNGEPGFWNSTYANEGEPNPLLATNPCGEIALEAWENCNLGHVNLDAFAEGGIFRLEEALYAHTLMTRFLIRATYGDFTDDRQHDVVRRNRRIGVGHFGFAGWLAKSGIRYSEAANENSDGGYIRSHLRKFKQEVRSAAREYSFQLRIPEPVKVTTVAPTGTIAKMPGRTEGIHPPYAKYFIRRIRFSEIHPAELRQLEELERKGYNTIQDPYAKNTWIVEIPTKEGLVEEVEKLGLDGDYYVQSVDEISLDDLFAVQAMYQAEYADNAVSFTANFPQGAIGLQELTEVLQRWLPLVKGTTVMPDGTRPLAPYERITREEYEAYTQNAEAATDSSFDDECGSGACPVR